MPKSLAEGVDLVLPCCTTSLTITLQIRGKDVPDDSVDRKGINFAPRRISLVWAVLRSYGHTASSDVIFHEVCNFPD